MQRIWSVWDNNLYDLTDYFNTQDTYSTYTSYKFLDSSIEDVFKQQAGKDITNDLNTALSALNDTYREQNINCLKNNFYVGKTDFRKTARCQVQNYMLIVFTVIIMSSVALKCSLFPAFTNEYILTFFPSHCCAAVRQ